jgi:hypothetical protein
MSSECDGSHSSDERRPAVMQIITESVKRKRKRSIFYALQYNKFYDSRSYSKKKSNKSTSADPMLAGLSRAGTTPFPKATPIDPKRIQQHGRAQVWKYYNHHPITNENECKACGHKT